MPWCVICESFNCSCYDKTLPSLRKCYKCGKSKALCKCLEEEAARLVDLNFCDKCCSVVCKCNVVEAILAPHKCPDCGFMKSSCTCTVTSPCLNCNGRGKLYFPEGYLSCFSCNGTGSVTKKKYY